MRNWFKCEEVSTGKTMSTNAHTEKHAAIHFAEELDGTETVLIRVTKEIDDNSPAKTFLVERRMVMICEAKEITDG